MLRTFARSFKLLNVPNGLISKPISSTLLYSTSSRLILYTNEIQSFNLKNTHKNSLNFFASNTSIYRKLEGKVAVITGGASGLGKATAEEFVSQGAKVIIVDIDEEAGDMVATKLGSAAHFLRCDVTEEEQVAKAVETVVSRHGKLDIMLNSAGISCSISPPSIADLDMDTYDKVMRLNVRGTILGIKHASRAMIPAGSGSILCLSSISGLMGGLGPHAYSISKFTIPGVVKTVASELCKHGLRINCISPAGIPTPLTLRMFREAFAGHNVPEEQLLAIVNATGDLKGEKCEEIDVAKAALYLASDDAKFVTGHNLVVDGGFTCFKSLNLPSA